MEIRVLAVGRLKERFYEEAQKEYLKRLSAFARVEVTELREELRGSGVTGETALLREKESILQRIPRDAVVIALCIEGKEMSSPQLASWLGEKIENGANRIYFVIGGSEGLHEEVKRRADLRLSMSPMTFPHHLARIMVLEQLYRAFDIRRGGKYHK